MKVSVQVKPRSKIEKVEPLADGSLRVRVNALPVDGAANERVIELLAKHFDRPKSAFTLVAGHRGKNKIFEIL